MLEKLLQQVADQGPQRCVCPHNAGVTITVLADSQKLVSCPVLAQHHAEGRKNRQGCQALERERGGVCPYEAHGNMLAQKTVW